MVKILHNHFLAVPESLRTWSAHVRIIKGGSTEAPEADVWSEENGRVVDAFSHELLPSESTELYHPHPKPRSAQNPMGISSAAPLQGSDQSVENSHVVLW